MKFNAYPNSRLCKIGPHSDLFSRRHVGVAVSREGRFQLLQLLAGEVRPLAALSFVFLVPFVVQRGLVGTDPRGRRFCLYRGLRC